MPASMCFIATRYLSVVEGARQAFFAASYFSTTTEPIMGSAASVAFPSLAVSVTKAARAVLPCYFEP
jgi:hypothetical protein